MWFMTTQIEPRIQIPTSHVHLVEDESSHLGLNSIAGWHVFAAYMSEFIIVKN